MTTKKLWIKTRLRQLGKTSAGLARHLRVEGPRVYEVIGGRRCLQPEEIERTAKFLDWSVDELLQKLPPDERILRLPKKPAPLQGTIVAAPGNGMTALVATIPLLDEDGEPKSYLTGGLASRSDLFAVYVTGKQMMPWCQDGELVVGEKNRPPTDNDHVVIFITVNRQKVFRVVQLLRGDDPDGVIVREHNPDKGPEMIERKIITAMCRIITWGDVLR